MKGKLIVIDGTDGSGKATQTTTLIKNLKKAGYRVARIDFPRYGRKSAALVEAYLKGELGSARKLGPYIPSLFYAVDRFAASHEIRTKLQKGQIVIANRYVAANLAHQGGKIDDKRARMAYYEWVLNLEYGLMKLPHPALNIILYLPAEVALGLVEKRGNKKDIHEKDLAHLRAAEKTYLEIAEKFGFPVIKCYQNGGLLSRAKVAELVWKKVKQVLR